MSEIVIQPLRVMTQAELSPTLHIGQADTPELGTRGMQELFDAHPNLNTATINENAKRQNINNAAIVDFMDVVRDELTQVIDAGGKTVNEHRADYNNPHRVTKAQIGLGSADDTSDIDKPVSLAVQAALNAKASLTYVDNLMESKSQQIDANAKAAAQSASQAAASKANAAQSEMNAAQSEANAAQSEANAAQSEANAAQSEERALDAVDRAKLAMIPASGHFALSVNGEGHLILSYADGDTPPDMEIDESGNLIMFVP